MKQIKVKRDYQAAPKGGAAVPIGASAPQVPLSSLPTYHGIPYSEIVDAWLGAQYEGGRHQQRVEAITAIEQRRN